MTQRGHGRGRGRLTAITAVAGLAAGGASIIGYAVSAQTHAPRPAPAAAGQITPRVPSTTSPAATTPAIPAPTPPSPPDRVAVSAIGVNSALVDLGLNADRTVAVPSTFQQAGWYEHSSQCGQPGPTVILGHVDSYQGPGVFFRLGALHPGDTVSVHCADGRSEQFEITGVRQYPKDAFPTLAVYGPTVVPTIRLVTCGGSFDRTTGHYLSDVVAFGQIASQS